MATVKAGTDSTELAVINNFALEPATISEFAAALKEELGDMGPLDLPQATAPSGNSMSWNVKQSADETQPEEVRALEGVIIARQHAYAYYANSKPMRGTRPQCASRDGVHGITIDGDVVKCKGCPYDAFGTAVDVSGSPGEGKACKQAFMVYLLREGDILPTRVKIPPTGVRRLGNYLKLLFVPKAGEPTLRGCDVVTRISFERATSKGGSQYAAPVFEAIGILPPGVGASLNEYGKAFLAAPDDLDVDIPGMDDGEVF